MRNAAQMRRPFRLIAEAAHSPSLRGASLPRLIVVRYQRHFGYRFATSSRNPFRLHEFCRDARLNRESQAATSGSAPATETVGNHFIPKGRRVLRQLVFWITVLFTSFGLFSPRNGTVIVALFVCALSVVGAIFLIVDLDQPFDGLIQVSRAPLSNALLQLGQ